MNNNLKILMGLCALLLSFQAYGRDVNVDDAWIRPITSGQDEAMVGMVVKSKKQARIVLVFSPAYKTVTMHGAGKSGANSQELEFIDLPANKSVVLDADNMYLQLSGKKQSINPDDKVPVFVTVQFDDKSNKTITVMAQPVLSKTAADTPVAPKVSAAPPPSATHNAEDSKAESKAAAVPVKPVPSKIVATPEVTPAPAKPAATHKKSTVTEAKPAKAEPAPVHVVTPPQPPVITPPTTPVAVVAAEPKKAPEPKPVEQTKPVEAQPSEDCINLALELRDCEKSNDIMLDWCVNNAKSKYSCSLSKDQLKKLRK